MFNMEHSTIKEDSKPDPAIKKSRNHFFGKYFYYTVGAATIIATLYILLAPIVSRYDFFVSKESQQLMKQQLLDSLKQYVNSQQQKSPDSVKVEKNLVIGNDPKNENGIQVTGTGNSVQSQTTNNFPPANPLKKNETTTKEEEVQQNKSEVELPKDQVSKEVSPQRIKQPKVDTKLIPKTKFTIVHDGQLKIQIFKGGNPITFIGYAISFLNPDNDYFQPIDVLTLNDVIVNEMWINLQVDESRWLLSRLHSDKQMEGCSLVINGQTVPYSCHEDYDFPDGIRKAANYHIYLQRK